jgi:phosphohistidine swiveling domain-containing protein
MPAEFANKPTKRYIIHLNHKKLPDSIGNKAANLRNLKDKKFRIPNTYVCTWDAYLDYHQSNDSVNQQLLEEINQIVDPTRSYAVRSSANLEDDLEHSFAGQFYTVLDVQGAKNILHAIHEIWEDTRSGAVHTYIEKKLNFQHELKMAVLIQEMIEPVVSGVVFSRNPITSFDEVLVEAVLGSGTSLVQKGITPLRWTYKWGNWTLTPENSPVPIDLILKVVKETKQIARIFRKDVDLEWVFDGQQLYWVQLRDITSVHKATIYSNKMAKEMSPGLIKPLVWSVSIPVPAQAWVQLISEMTGNPGIQAESLVRAFYYQAYYNMGVFGDIWESLGLPRESLEMMMGILPPGAGRLAMKPSRRMIRLTPRVVRFLKDKWAFAERFEANYPRLYERAHQFSLQPAPDLDDDQIISTIDQIMALNAEVTYFTVVNILLMQAYHAMLRSRLKKMGVDFQKFNLTEGMVEFNRYNPESQLKTLNQQYKALSPEKREVFERGDYLAFQQLQGCESLQRQVQDFFELFGHLSDTTSNFSSIPWRETPGLILQLIADYQPPIEAMARIGYNDLPKQNWSLALVYRRARQFQLYRDQISSLYTFILMLARAYYLALAERMVHKGFLANRDDIFYLFDPEIRAGLRGETAGECFLELTRERKQEMERCKDAILPEIIFGEEIPLILTTATDKLIGTPTSKGYYTGITRIIRGIQDFPKLSPGDVLVIPYSDAGWTPLFAKAGAVIAESGGILSHSSIIAREYNIPAVVSVTGALGLKDGTLVTIDGFKGEIIVHPDPVEQGSRVDQQNIVDCRSE